MKRPIVNAVSYVLMVVVNAMATTIPLNGRTTEELSDMYPSLFTPAGYVFSIWGVIYVALGAFVIFQLLPAQRTNPRIVALGYWFAVNAVLNAGWIVAWHYEQVPLSLLVMVCILLTLIHAYRLLEIGRTDVAVSERWAAHLGFSIYLGWISVASVANVSVFLIDRGFDGGDYAPIWTAAAVLAAALLGVASLLRRGDIAFGLVLIWAFTGIAVRQSTTNTVIVAAALLAAATLAVLIVRQLLVQGAERATG